MRFPTRILVFLPIFALTAFLQAEETLRITSPAADEAVYGSVEIVGTAAAPGMMRYRVEFAYDPNPTETWFLIAEGTEPVRDGVLAVWDTTPVSEGDYALRVAAFFADGSMRDAVTRGIRVRRNASAAAQPPEETVLPAGSATQIYGRVAAAFPAPTAVAAPEPPAAPRPASPRGIAFLTGAGLAVLGFGIYWIRSRWLWWKHRQFVRRIRKSESRHD